MILIKYYIIHLALLLQLFSSTGSVHSQGHHGHASSSNYNYPHPICVVGAGLSGLNIGLLLKAKGYTVALYEEKPRVGGKVSTYRVEPNITLIHRGPVLFTNTSSTLIGRLEEFGLSSRVIPFDIRDPIGFDPFSGSIQPLPSQSNEDRALVLTAFERYVSVRAEYNLDSDIGYLDASPELFLPFSQWLTSQNLSVILPFFVFPITVLGYGHLEDTPALYVLKLIDEGNVRVLTGQGQEYYTLYDGWTALVERMAESLDIHLSHKLTSIIRRSPRLQELEFNFGASKGTCSKVILAFPPLLKSLEGVIKDMNTEETNVFGQVKVHKYTSAGHHIPSLNGSLYYEAFRQPDPSRSPEMVLPEGRCEVVGLARQSTKMMQDVYSSYSWIRGSYDTAATEFDLQRINDQLQSFLRKISPSSKTYFLDTTEYFPHVTTQSLQEGFYRKLDDIQGKNGLYYATTLLTFEIMDKALEMSVDFVDKYF